MIFIPTDKEWNEFHKYAKRIKEKLKEATKNV